MNGLSMLRLVSRYVFVALALLTCLTSDAWADRKYVVQVGVFENIGLCPAYYGYPCDPGPFGPIKGVRVTIRTKGGELKARLRTNSKGVVRVQLRNGRYVASINLPGFNQEFLVQGGRVNLPLAVGEAKFPD